MKYNEIKDFAVYTAKAVEPETFSPIKIYCFRKKILEYKNDYSDYFFMYESVNKYFKYEEIFSDMDVKDKIANGVCEIIPTEVIESLCKISVNILELEYFL
jgi:hypothetical protein